MEKSNIYDLETHKLIESARESMSESQLDIIRRALRRLTHNEAEGGADDSGHSEIKEIGPRRRRLERHTGNYSYRVKDREILAGNQKSAYKGFLLALEEEWPGFLVKFAKRHTPSRNYIAKSPQELFRNGADLADTAERLNDDWFVDVNLSRNQKIVRAKRACETLKINWEEDAFLRLR
ncbi:MAG: hypothetical protein AAGG45_07795 [Pseudomonadota bacterium]